MTEKYTFHGTYYREMIKLAHSDVTFEEKLEKGAKIVIAKYKYNGNNIEYKYIELPPFKNPELLICDDLEEQHPITEEQRKKAKEWYSKCLVGYDPAIPGEGKTVKTTFYKNGIVDFILQEQPWWKRNENK